MGLHAYCVVPAGVECSTTGIGGASVRSVPHGAVAVWTSQHAQRPAATLEAARAHDAVIRSTHDEQLTPVPLRFGQWFEDEARLVATVGARAAAWHALLRELAGRLEMGLRVTGRAAAPQPIVPVVSSGTAYMQALLERHRAAAAVAAQRAAVLAELRTALAGLVEKEFVAPETTAGTLLSVAYLVRRALLGAYQAAIIPVHERFASLRFHTSGPWPPYSFVA